MVKCPICRKKHPENTLHCDECGAYLPGGNGAATAPLAAAEVTGMEREDMDVTSPLILKLTIPESGRDVEVPLTKEVSIGRVDGASASLPDVDLSKDGGLEKGVSRRHARIARRGNEVFVEDLGSMNGTFLNCEKLRPRISQALKSGDELQLGQLTLRVSFT